ncbi:MAG: sugar phosphate nucleotidyltransferase [Salinirussus sp.]
MQGVVLAAGEGTRLRPLTADRPKGLVEVAGQPILSHCFETLASLGAEEFVVVIGYRGDRIVDRYGDSFCGRPVSYVRQDDREGLADAVLTARPAVDGDFLVVNGDNVYDASLSPVVSRHRETGADATVLLDTVPAERAGRAGVFERDDGELVGLVEKPAEAPSREVPRGLYAFSPRIFSACERIDRADTGEFELTDAIDRLVAAEDARVEVVELDGWAKNVNTPADRREATRHFGE